MIKKRVILWWMLLCGIVIHIFQSTNINVAIISMVKYQHEENTNSTDVCVVSPAQVRWNHSQTNNTAISSALKKNKFNWTEAEQNLILGGYYWLCWAVQFLGGLLSHKYGTKLVFGSSVFLSSLLSAAIPPLAPVSDKVVLALRVLQGAVASTGFPAGMFPIIGAWAPPDETGRFSALFLGMALGVTFGYPLFGIIAQKLGWEWIFYFTALCGTIWYIFWQLLIFDSPNSHPKISEEEKSYLKNCQRNRVARGKLPIPWRKITTSIPVLTCISLTFAQSWALFTFNIYMPSYFKNVFGLGLTESGLIIGAAFLVRIIFQIVGAAYTDRMIRRGTNETTVRKLAVWGGSIIPGIILCLVLFTSCHYLANVAILSGFVILTAITSSGGQAALMNMSPNFSGVIQGMNFTLGTTSGILSPLLFGFLQQNYSPLKLYQYVFLVTAILNIITGLLFIIYLVKQHCNHGIPVKKMGNDQKNLCPWTSHNFIERIILLWMLYFVLLCNTLVTVNLNVAIISMVRSQQGVQEGLNHTKVLLCPNTTFLWGQNNQESGSASLLQEDVYDWSDYEKRTALSAYHWLSWLSILPGSILAQKFGSKIILGYSLLISAVMSSIIPFAAHYGATVVMYIRMIQGFFSFITVPGGMLTIIGNWSSDKDRGIFVAVCLVGSSTALGLGNYVFGYIGQYLHWKYIFHLTSLCGIVWSIFWYFLIHDYPDRHPTISIKEKTKILKNLNYAVNDEKIPIPWKCIFTSVPVIVCTLLIGASMTNFFILVTFMPTYLNDVYGLGSNQAGTITSLPQFICGLGGLIIGWFTDLLVKKRWLSLTKIRKLFSLGGCVSASTMLIIMAFTKCDLTIIVISYIICTVSRSIDIFGIEPVVIDMSPKFCGIIQGIMGTITELMDLVIVAGMSQLTFVLPAAEFWKVVFLFTASFGIISSILFLIWGTAELQPWNQGSKRFQIPSGSHMSEVCNLPQEEN